MPTVQQIQDAFDSLVSKFPGMAVTAVIDGETTTAVMSQMATSTNELLDEGESNEIGTWLRFKYTDLTTEPTPNDSTATIDSTTYSIVEVVTDSVKATMRVRLEDRYADI